MSGPAQSAVLLHSKQTSFNHYKLLQYIAHGADIYGINRTAPTRETLAAHFQTTTRTISRWLSTLEESGELITLRKGSGPGRPSQYKINLPIPNTQTSSPETAVSEPSNLEKTVQSLADDVAILQQQMGDIIQQKGDKGDKNQGKCHPLPPSDPQSKGDKNGLICHPLAAKGDKGDSQRVTRGTAKGDTLTLESADDPFDPKRSFDPEEEELREREEPRSTASPSPLPAEWFISNGIDEPKTAEQEQQVNHPATLTWLHATNRWPTYTALPYIIRDLGDSPDTAALREAWDGWNIAGYRPDNVTGILDKYSQIVTRKQRNGRGAAPTRQPDTTAEFKARLAASYANTEVPTA